MVKYIVTRLVGIVLVLLLVSVLLFFLSMVIPGDPIARALDEEFETTQNVELNEALYQQKAIELHKNLPHFYFAIHPRCVPDTLYKVMKPEERRKLRSLLVREAKFVNDSFPYNKTHPFLPHFVWNGADNQYHFFLRSLLNLETGKSIRDGVPIFEKMKKPLRITLVLSFLALTFAIVGAWFFGLARVKYPSHKILSVFEQGFDILYAMPTFWITTLCILFFCTSEFHLRLFPSPGLPDTFNGNGGLQYLIHLPYFILPSLCLAIHLFIVLAQHFKTSLLDNEGELFFKTARAKGLSYGQSVQKHLVPNAIFPFLTLIGQVVPVLITGTFVIEYIFNLPGMGRLTFDAINDRDWLMVQTVFMASSAILLSQQFND